MTNPIIQVRKAARQKCMASIMIEGLSGMGKSGLALIIAKGLVGSWDKIGSIDTENKSTDLYVGINSSLGEKFGQFLKVDFDNETGYRPSLYLDARKALLQANCTAVINDSVSHSWSYKGGILDLVASKKQNNARYQRDSYAAWGDEEIVKEKNELLSLLRDNQCHIISTVRVKEKLEYDKDDTGKTVLTSLGDQQIMQADIKYEPDLVLSMVSPGAPGKAPEAKVIKTRYAIFNKGETYAFTPELIEQLRVYLNEGVDPEVLLEEQRQEYVAALKDLVKAKPTLKPIFDMLKGELGYAAEQKVNEMSLEDIKQIFIKLNE